MRYFRCETSGDKAGEREGVVKHRLILITDINNVYLVKSMRSFDLTYLVSINI